jgi:hypothetical protein
MKKLSLIPLEVARNSTGPAKNLNDRNSELFIKRIARPLL